MTVTKPLQVICSSAACRRRQTVAADRAWYVDVKSGPGSHREAGWRCRFCGMENTTPPSHLPRDTVPMLSSRQDVLERVAASDRKRTGLDRQRTAPIVESEALIVPEKAEKGPSPNVTLAATPTAVTTPTKQETSVVYPNLPVRAEHRYAEGIVEPDRPLPTWVVGSSAKMVLIDALARISRHGGDAVAIADRRSGFEKVSVDLPHDDMDRRQIARFADEMLKVLDGMRADFVVLGGNVAGRRWQAVLHITAGAASFV